MEKHPFMRRTLILVVLTTMILSQVSVSNSVVREYDAIGSEHEIASIYTDHAPISIDGNSDFLGQASIEGWSGDGSPESPFIISGYRISDSDIEGIKIWNVDCYWKITDCLIEGGAPYAYGIYLGNASNGVVSNNIIRERDIAIQASLLARNCVFSRNEIYDNQNNAIKALNGMVDCVISANYMNNNSANNIWIAGGFNSSNVVDNQIIGGDNGIRVNLCRDCIFRNNTVSESHTDSIVLPFIVDTSIINNKVFNSGGMGIMFSGSFILVEGNQVQNSTNAGLYMSSGANCTLRDNHAVNCVGYGLSLGGSASNTSVRENIFIDNNSGDCQVEDDGDNNFIIYNHYNDWISPDEDSDNIVDVPYAIEGDSENADPYPLVDPNVGIPTSATITTTTTTSNSGSFDLILYAGLGLIITLVVIAVVLRRRQ